MVCELYLTKAVKKQKGLCRYNILKIMQLTFKTAAAYPLLQRKVMVTTS